MKELMVHVERVVRPVQASAGRKDRMREELLAHLTGIFEEERARLGDERVALEQALNRLGDRSELTRHLQESVSGHERYAYYLERWLGWRPPETPVRHMLRLTFLLTFLLFLPGMVLVAAVIAMAVMMGARPGMDLVIRLRVGMCFLLIMYADVFLLGQLYFKMRDALCRASGVRRWLRAAGLGALSALVVPASGIALSLLAVGSLEVGFELLFFLYPFAILVPVAFTLCALFHGPTEIRHAEWCCLDLGE